MRLAHKRNVQKKLHKRLIKSATISNQINKPKAEEIVAQSKPVSVAKVATPDLSLTPKQQQVLDIILASPEGINTKSIGIEAGQEEAKAAAWSTGAIKKLLENNLVEKVSLAGNKVIYKAV